MRHSKTIATLFLALGIALTGCNRDEFGKQAEGGAIRADSPTESDDDAANGGNNANEEPVYDAANNLSSPNNASAPDEPDLNAGDRSDNEGLRASGVLAYKAYRTMSARSENIVLGPVGLARSFAIASMAASNADVQSSILGLMETDADPWTFNENLSDAIVQLESSAAPGQLRLLPSVWAQDGASVEEPFLIDLATYYDMGVQLVDFRATDARTTINTWFRNRTDGYIVDAVAPRALPPETRLALIDAAFFEGRWSKGFDPDLGYDGTFRGLRENVSVRMMRKTETLPYTANALAEAIELPYDTNHSLVVVLPREDTLATVEAALSTDWLEGILAEMSPSEVDLSFPKVEVAGRFDLDDGTEDFAFAEAARAEQAFENAGADLTLGNILQRTTIRFEETSTSAVSPNTETDGEGAQDPAAGIAPLSLVLDRPFLFAVRDSASGAVILLGRVGQPVAL